MILKIFADLKKEWGRLDSSLVKNDKNKLAKIKMFAGTNRNFLSHAHYTDPYFDFFTE